MATTTGSAPALKGVLKLRKSIEINGKEIHSLSFDSEQIDLDLMSQAETQARQKRSAKDTVTMTLGETDYTYHLFLGMAAVIAVNPWIDWEDLKRIKGNDLKMLGNIGRLFFMEQGVLEDETSEELPELTVDISTQD